MDEQRAVRRLALANGLSGIGSDAAAIVLSADVYYRTGSAVWLSASFFLTFGITGLLNLPAGVIVDRFERRRTMVLSDILSTALWLVIIPVDSPTGLLAIGFIGAVVGSVRRLGTQAALPVLAGETNLARANGTNQTAFALASILGPPLGGLLFGSVGPGSAFAINAASFACSAALVRSISRPFGDARTEHQPSGRILSGLRHLWGDVATRSLFVVWVLLYLTVDVAVVADLPISRLFGWGTFGYGVIGTGALIGSLFARRIPRRWEPSAVLVGGVGIGVGYLIVSVAPAFSFVLVGNFLWAFLDSGDVVAGTSILQRRSPDHLRGRVFGALAAGGLLANAVGFSFAGFLVEALGPKATYGLCGVASLVVLPLLTPMFGALRSRTTPRRGR